MPAQYGINEVYVQAGSDGGNNKFIDTVLASSLTPNNQMDEGNFFSRTGMLGRMTGDTFSNDSPIQRAEKLNRGQGQKFRFFLGGFMVGEVRVGDSTSPKAGGQTLGRHWFELETVSVYAPSLDVPKNDPNRHVSVPILAGYMKALREWWGAFAEETLLIFGLASMRGQSENYETYVSVNSDGNADLRTTVDEMTAVIQDMSAVNPIYKPTTHFTAWGSGYNPASVANPNTATASDYLTMTDIDTIMTYLQERNRVKDGFKIRPGSIMFPSELNAGKSSSNYQYSSMKDFVWLITPSVKRDLIEHTGANTFANYQTDLVQAVGRGTVFDNHMIGRIYGATFMEYRKLPRALGGSAGDVPICRTMILGSQSAVYASSNFTIPSQYLARFQQRTRRYTNLGLPIRMWNVEVEQGEKSLIRTESNIGCSVLHWTDPKSTRRDRGRIIMDVATSSLEGNSFS